MYLHNVQKHVFFIGCFQCHSWYIRNTFKPRVGYYFFLIGQDKRFYEKFQLNGIFDCSIENMDFFTCGL